MIDSTMVGRLSVPTTVCVIQVATFEGESITAELTPVLLASDAAPLSVEVNPFLAGAKVRVIVWVAQIVRETVENSSDETSDVG